MPDYNSDHNAHNAPGMSGLLTALISAALLIGAFALNTADVTMPASERWAALTTFALLTLAFTVQGSPELYDRLGMIVRRDSRTLIPLLLLIPALYISYSLAVDEFSWAGLLIALAFVTLPALVFLQSRARRLPTMFDLIATLYLLLSLELHLLPTLQLPQQGGQVHFFFLSLAPLLLLLLAARGWPGLGFTWFMNWRDLRTALLTAGGVLLLLSPLALAFNLVQPASSIPPTIAILTGAVQTYFLIALPQEILFRGLIQNGIERFTDAKLWRGAGSASEQHSASLYNPRVISLGFAAVIAGSTSLTNPIAPPEHVLLAVLAHLGYGWVYQHTGKVTVSAVTHMLVVWGWLLLFV